MSILSSFDSGAIFGELNISRRIETTKEQAIDTDLILHTTRSVVSQPRAALFTFIQVVIDINLTYHRSGSPVSQNGCTPTHQNTGTTYSITMLSPSIHLEQSELRSPKLHYAGNVAYHD